MERLAQTTSSERGGSYRVSEGESMRQQLGGRRFCGVGHTAWTAVAVAILALPAAVRAQDRITEELALAVPASRPDAVALAMGNAYVADGWRFNGLFYNPALPSRAAADVELLGLGVALGQGAVEGARFLDDNQSRILNLEDEFRIAANALGQGNSGPMNALLEFSDEFLDLYGEPLGGRVEPSVAVRVGDVTLALYGAVQAAAVQSPLLAEGRVELLHALRGIRFPLDTAELNQLADLLVALDAGNVDVTTLLGLGVADVVAAVNYGFELIPNFRVGVTGKLVNRRVGLRLVPIDELDAPYQRSLADIRQSDTRFGVDVGAVYAFPELPLSVGVSIIDLVADDANVNPLGDGFEIGTAQDLRDELEANGLTRFIIEDPSPTVVTLGASLQVGSQLRLNADLHDIADQTDLLDDAIDHLRLGAELAPTPGVALRAGLSSSHPSAGGGLALGPVQLAYAFYFDDFLDRYAHRGQLRLAF